MSRFIIERGRHQTSDILGEGRVHKHDNRDRIALEEANERFDAATRARGASLASSTSRRITFSSVLAP
jgi:hypothetical protein